MLGEISSVPRCLISSRLSAVSAGSGSGCVLLSLIRHLTIIEADLYAIVTQRHAKGDQHTRPLHIISSGYIYITTHSNRQSTGKVVIQIIRSALRS
ncbi:hypothetical protein CBOM_08034 [Ceraceosorus bombacis]|uniref:Uncharacterized protein n=1 Tax=Ceraceosorus bombacis TaxID=401625 RepID=A0A0P1BJB7_9BASI|nr:hypothetical protein CBOM_08034 [Ceraceosorus bombacis]